MRQTDSEQYDKSSRRQALLGGAAMLGAGARVPHGHAALVLPAPRTQQARSNLGT